MDRLLVGLAHLDRLLDRLVPSITLSIGRRLEAVRLVVQAEGKLVRACLLQIRCVVQRKNASWVGLASLVLLDEEEKTLASLACPSNDWVSNLGLLTTKVEVEVLRSDGLIAEPEILLSESELPKALSVSSHTIFSNLLRRT